MDTSIGSPTKRKVRPNIKADANKHPRKDEVTITRRVSKTGEPVDKSKIRMGDLIRYNPPMTKEQQAVRDMQKVQNKTSNDSELVATSEVDPEATDLEEEASNEEEDDEEGFTAPRVKVDANGQIVLDEESCVIQRKKAPEGKTVFEDNQMVSSSTTYSSFRHTNYKGKQKWTEEETKLFYKGLSICGTDFTMMSKILFKNKRDRKELKKKFKKEEKKRKDVVDEILSTSNLTDLPGLEVLDASASSDEDENPD